MLEIDITEPFQLLLKSQKPFSRFNSPFAAASLFISIARFATAIVVANIVLVVATIVVANFLQLLILLNHSLISL